MSKHIEIDVKKIWLTFGYTAQFGLGFNINRYALSVDLGPFYIGVEW